MAKQRSSSEGSITFAESSFWGELKRSWGAVWLMD